MCSRAATARPRGDVLDDPRRGARALRRDLLERLQQPHLPRRRAAAAAAGGRAARLSLPLTIERDLPICRVWQLGSRGRMKLLRGDWADALADADDGARRPERPARADVAAPRARPGRPAPRRRRRRRPRRGVGLALPLRRADPAAAGGRRRWSSGRGCGASPTTASRRVPRPARRRPGGRPGVGARRARRLAAPARRRHGATRPRPRPDDVAEPYRLQLAGRIAAAAADCGRSCRRPYDQALALVDAGTADARAGRPRPARPARRRRGGGQGPPGPAAPRRDDDPVAPAPGHARANPAGLTSREVEILRLLGDGSTNAEIAQRLFISPKTVDHHVSALLSKLQVTSRRARAAGRRTRHRWLTGGRGRPGAGVDTAGGEGAGRRMSGWCWRNRTRAGSPLVRGVTGLAALARGARCGPRRSAGRR